MPLLEPTYSPSTSISKYVRVSEVSYNGTNSFGRRLFVVAVKFGSLDYNVTVSDPYFTKQEDELTWALEEYAAISPFESDRAAAVTTDLRAYGESLFKQLKLMEAFNYDGPEDEKKGIKIIPNKRASGKCATTRWILDIEALEASDINGFHSLHWEALEIPDLSYFQVGAKPGSICVRRKMPLHNNYIDNIPVSIKAKSINVLLISSYTESPDQQVKNEDDPMLMAKTMVETFASISKSGITCPVRLEIVRPGTWEALKTYLNSYEKGYFHLVHFDVQGKVVDMEDKEQDVYLAFDAEDDSCAREWRSVGRVSQLLVQHGIRFVVTNAPRTCRAGKVSPFSPAQTFVQAGVRGAIGFAYRSLDASKARFFKSFYQHFFITMDFAIAVQLARNQIFKHNESTGRFKAKVHVDDWLSVQVHHCNGTIVRFGDSDSTNDRLSNVARSVSARAESKVTSRIGRSALMRTSTGSSLSSGKSHISSIGIDRAESPPRNNVKNGAVIEISEVYLTRGNVNGRDVHLKQIESKILTKSNLLKLSGSIGSGKSSILIHLAWWWKTTHLIKDFFYFDYYLRPTLSVDSIYRYIYTTLFPGLGQVEPQRSYSPVSFVRGRSKTRSREPSPTPSATNYNWKHMTEYQAHLVPLFPNGWLETLIQHLKETPYLIVLDSIDCSSASADKCEASKQEINDFLAKLKGGRTVIIAASCKNESWINDILLEPGNHYLPPIEMQHAVAYAENVQRQYNGDPLRLEGRFSCNYLELIIQLCGRLPLLLELILPSVVTDERPMKQVYLHMLQGAMPLGTAQTAALYAVRSMRMLVDLIEGLELDVDSKRMLFCITPFWEVFPKNFDKYLAFLIYHKALPVDRAWRSSFDMMAASNVSAKDMDTIHTILKISGVSSQFEILLNTLQGLGLLTESKSDEYYAVHPLLTLFLRQEIAKEKDKADPKELIDYTAVTRAFVSLYKRYGQEWKASPDYTYSSALDTIRLEESNILSAISLSVNFKNVEDVFQSFPLHTFSRYAALCMVDKRLGHFSDALKSLVDLCLIRFEEFETAAARSKKKLDSTSILVALTCSNWLCEYHSEFSSASSFMDQVDVSRRLMEVVERSGSEVKILTQLADLEEQASKGKCHALQDGMLSGLTLRRPWSGLFTRAIPYPTSFPRDEDTEVAAHQLAMSFRGLNSLAAQSYLSHLLKDPLATQLKKDLLILWRACLKQLKGTPLERFLTSYTWVSPLLSPQQLTPPPTPTRKFRTTPFLAYADVLRAALYFYLQDHSAAQKTLETGILRAKLHCSADASLVLQILITKTRDQTLDVDFPSDVLPQNSIYSALRTREIEHTDLDEYLHLLMHAPSPPLKTCLSISRFTRNLNAEFKILSHLGAQGETSYLVEALLLPGIPTHAKSEILCILASLAPNPAMGPHNSVLPPAHTAMSELAYLESLEPLLHTSGADLKTLIEFLLDVRREAEVKGQIDEEWRERVWESAVRLVLGDDSGQEGFRGSRWSEGLKAKGRGREQYVSVETPGWGGFGH